MNWHDILTYDEGTGHLTWKEGQRNAGKVAGCEMATPTGSRYIVFKYQGKVRYAHRVIWEMQTGRPPAQWIDHINGIGTDNRWGNLREASPTKNGYNRKVDVRNKTGVTGVHYDRKKRKFKASITVDGRRHHLGSFDDKRAAILAVNEARHRLHGEFAPLSLRSHNNGS